MCNCLHPDAMRCTAKRYDATLTLVACLDAACRCCCHQNADGTAIVHDQWRPLTQHIPAVKKAIPYGAPKQPTSAKLTPEHVVEIRNIGSSLSQAAIARRYNVDPRTIGRILRGEQWQLIEERKEPA